MARTRILSPLLASGSVFLFCADPLFVFFFADSLSLEAGLAVLGFEVGFSEAVGPASVPSSSSELDTTRLFLPAYASISVDGTCR